MSASLFRRLSAFFESTSRPRSQSGKVRRSDTRPGDVRKRAVRVEGNDSAPSETPRVSPCEPLCAIFLREPSVLPTFTRESERGPFVGEVEKRLGIKFMAAALPDYSLLLVLRVHREPGNVCI